MRAPKAPTIVLPPSTVADDKAVEPTDEDIAKKLAEEAARQGRSSFFVNASPTINTGLNIPGSTY